MARSSKSSSTARAEQPMPSTELEGSQIGEALAAFAKQVAKEAMACDNVEEAANEVLTLLRAELEWYIALHRSRQRKPRLIDPEPLQSPMTVSQLTESIPADAGETPAETAGTSTGMLDQETRKTFQGLLDELLEAKQAAKALVNKGLTLGQAGQIEEELAACDEVIRRYGERSEAGVAEQVARALFNKGLVLGHAGRIEEELAVYDEVIRRYGERLEAGIAEQVAMSLVNTGVRLGGGGRLEEALAAYNEVIRRYGRRPEAAFAEPVNKALLDKAIRLAEAGRHEEAHAAYDEVWRYRRPEAALAEPVVGAKKGLAESADALTLDNESETGQDAGVLSPEETIKKLVAELIPTLPPAGEEKAETILALNRTINETFWQELRDVAEPLIKSLLENVPADYEGKRRRATLINALLAALDRGILIHDENGQSHVCSMHPVRGRQSDGQGYLRLIERTRRGSAQKSFAIPPLDQVDIIETAHQDRAGHGDPARGTITI